MEQEPLISVIVPVYNGEKFLNECLDSIEKQTYRHFEAIIINDGSTDATLSILNRYAAADKRFKVFSQDNTGQSGARNAALDLVSGKYLTMVDADDIIDKDFLKTLYVLSIETGDDIVACRPTQDMTELGLYNDVYSSVDSLSYMKLTLSQKAYDHSVWGKLYKTDIWENIRFKDLYYEDLEVFPRIFLKTPNVTVTNARLYFYRSNENSFINTFSPKRLDVLKSADNVISTLREHDCNTSIIDAAYSRKLSALFNMYFITYGRPEFSQIHNRCWNDIVQLRGRFIFNPISSLKLRAGIAASYLGRNFILYLNRKLNISK